MDPSENILYNKRREVSRGWSEDLTRAAARTTPTTAQQQLNKKRVSVAAEAIAELSATKSSASATSMDSSLGSSDNNASHSSRHADEISESSHRRQRRSNNASNDEGANMVVGARSSTEEAELSGAERDAAHFKMVAARFRALMERRERRLEEAMSDPQTRTDLEAMFPGMKQGDYQTLLAGVRGMEEEDFQALLAGARKRRREVGDEELQRCSRGIFVGEFSRQFVLESVQAGGKRRVKMFLTWGFGGLCFFRSICITRVSASEGTTPARVVNLVSRPAFSCLGLCTFLVTFARCITFLFGCGRQLIKEKAAIGVYLLTNLFLMKVL